MHCNKIHHTSPKGHLLHCVMITINYSICIMCTVHEVEFSQQIYMITEHRILILQKFVARKLICIICFDYVSTLMSYSDMSILTANIIFLN